MVIYVEAVIINNLVINAIILYSTSLLTKRRFILWQSLIGSLIGTAYALVSPLIVFRGSIAIKIVLSLIICLVSSRFSKIKEFLIYTSVFYIVTFFIGGSIMGIANLSKTVYESIYDPNNISLALILSVATVIFCTIKFFIRCHNVKKVQEYEVKVQIGIGEKLCEKNGYLDSGNNLYYKGLYPIVVLDKIEGLKPKGKISVKTVNSSTIMPVYPIKNLRINGKDYKNIYAIEQTTNCKHEIILHSSMI